MPEHLRVRHRVASYSRTKFKFFAHQDETKAREPKSIHRLRKCANKNVVKAPIIKDTTELS